MRWLTPNIVTLAGCALCALSGALVGLGYLVAAGLVYLAGGLLDAVDGRLARHLGMASPEGAFLDSVTDRWSELFVVGGLALYLHAQLGTAASLLCLGSAQMVSYTRARAEALGLPVASGTMQRAERIIAVSVAMFAGALGNTTRWFDGRTTITALLFAVGVMNCGTAVHRLVAGLRRSQLASVRTDRARPSTSRS
jgi:CDP-diacylglycerol--glycerol-3-phosphate 3-phosphatidyltransferase